MSRSQEEGAAELTTKTVCFFFSPKRKYRLVALDRRGEGLGGDERKERRCEAAAEAQQRGESAAKSFCKTHDV